MPTLLQIQSSLLGDYATSTTLANALAAHWKEKHTDGQVVTRDLMENNLPYLTGEAFSAFKGNATSEKQKAAVLLSDTLIQEIQNADAIILTAPMYNFGIPAILKTYFDYIVRAGVSFKYTETGPVGLLADKPVYVINTRGGQYQDTPLDTEAPYLKIVLNFIGLKNLHFIYAEGLGMHNAADSKEAALAQIQALPL